MALRTDPQLRRIAALASAILLPAAAWAADAPPPEGELIVLSPASQLPEGAGLVLSTGDPLQGFPCWDPVEGTWTDLLTLSNPPGGPAVPLPLEVRMLATDPEGVVLATPAFSPEGWIRTEVRSTRERALAPRRWLLPGASASQEVSFRPPEAGSFIVYAGIGEMGTAGSGGFVYDSSAARSWKLPEAEPLPRGAENLKVLAVDDGTRERAVGSVSGSLIVGNRFRLSGTTRLHGIYLVSAVGPLGADAELILYHDPTGQLDTPAGARQVYRGLVPVNWYPEPRVQYVSLYAANLLVEGGNLFVTLRNVAGASYKLGVDSTRPSGHGVMSINHGENWFPFSLEALGDSQPIIRAVVSDVDLSAQVESTPEKLSR